MENYNEINKKIAKNLAYYRKQAGLTQAELAEKINYSDKSVSKWELGNGVPDVYILMQLAELYGVTLNDLVGETTPQQLQEKRKGRDSFHVLITLLSCGIVWLVATYFFVTMEMWKPQGEWWLAFIYAADCTFLVSLIFACIWKYRVLNFICTSGLIWCTITCAFLTLGVLLDGVGGLWLLFLLGVPLQVLEILWVFFRSLFRPRTKREEKEKETEMETSAS